MNQRLYQKKGETMDIVLSTHFTYRKLLRFVFPSLATMIFLSTYSIIDGFFVSNYVGDIAFAAINLIFPVIMIFGCVGSVIGAGGSALIGKRLGEGREVDYSLPCRWYLFYGLYYVNLCLGFHALDGGSYGGAGTDSDRQCFLAVYCLFPFLCTGSSAYFRHSPLPRETRLSASERMWPPA